MGILKGGLKVIVGIIEFVSGQIVVDGPGQKTLKCPKCGRTIHMGNCMPKRDLVTEGVKEIKTTLIDDERKARERGWERAEKKFKPAVEKIKSEIEEIQAVYNSKDVRADKLITEIEIMRERKKSLESKLAARGESLSKKSGVDTSVILSSIGPSSCIGGSNKGFCVFDLLFSGKETKLRKLEKDGFNDAKAFYEKEITDAKAEFEEKKALLEPDIQDLADLIDMVMADIAEIRMKIAELEALV